MFPRFYSPLAKTLQLSSMSLATPEDAVKALETINELRNKVQAHRRTARALKQLIISEAPVPASPPPMVSGSSLLH